MKFDDFFGMQDQIYIPPTHCLTAAADTSVKEARLVSPLEANTVVNNWWTILNPRGEARVWQADLCASELPAGQSHQFCIFAIFASAWRCFSNLPVFLLHTVSSVPCSRLSANTFTFLVLLSNKRGGMSVGLCTLTKTNISLDSTLYLSRLGHYPPSHSAG